MSETLKPCPFCGGEAEIIDEHDEYIAKWGEPFDEWEFGTASYWYKAVVCSVDKGGCGAIGGWRKTEAEAIAAWNTRAERTCEIYRVGNTQDLRKCSACGELMHFGHPLDRSHLNYCPNCGRKIVAP